MGAIIAEWLRRLWYLINRRRFEGALQQEMEAHRERMGEPARFGNALRLREESRDVWGWNWLDNLWRELRYAIRGLRREPTFALTATLTLALGVVTTTTVFSVVDAELWRPLPFPHREQLVAAYWRGPGQRAMAEAISGADLLDWRAAGPAFSDLAATGPTTRRVLRLATAESVLITEVTANYFTTLGRPAIIGRTLSAEDAHGTRVAVLTDRAWRRLFAADPSVVGRALTLDADSIVVAGVVSADDSLGSDPDLFIALSETTSGFLDRKRPLFYSAVGRLQPDADAAVARAQLQSVAGQRTGYTAYIEDLRAYHSAGNSRPLYFFLGASVVVLILSVVNVATLLLARAFRRTREFALRGALGGSQRALARQLLVEGGLLAFCGAAAGTVLTMWAVEFFAAQLPPELLARGSSIPMDLRVYAFVLVVTGLITAGFVLAPLFPVRRFDLSNSLNGVRTGRTADEGRLRTVLLTVQIALTVVLLSGAGIFLKSFIALTGVPLGFDPENALTIRATLSGPRYATDDAIRAYADELLNRARAIPGVRLAAVGTSSPLGSGPLIRYTVAGNPIAPDGYQPRAILRSVSSDYFQTLGIRILRGREFNATDATGAPRVAIVNETLARERFGGADPLGRVIDLQPGGRSPWTNRPGGLLIVGVVANVKEVGLNEIEFADVYVPFAQTPAPTIEMVVKAHVPTSSISGLLREQAAGVDPAIPVISVSTLENRVGNVLQRDRFNLLLISGFAGVALLLAAVAIYGAVAYSVQARTRELGVRLALGARPWSLVFTALWQAARVGIVGGAMGLSGALALAVVLDDALYLVPGSHNGLLYGVTTTDPAMLAGAFVGIVIVAVLAGAVPAHRVARVDPVRALRNE